MSGPSSGLGRSLRVTRNTGAGPYSSEDSDTLPLAISMPYTATPYQKTGKAFAALLFAVLKLPRK